MTDQSSVFSTEEPATQPQTQTPSQESQQPPQEPATPAPSASSDTLFADQLASIKNERGEPKYKDPQTALEALKHSQDYIPQLKQQVEMLKQENEGLKSNQEQMARLEETIERLTSQRTSSESTPAQQGLTPEQVQELLEQQLTVREQKQIAVSNSQKVSDAITQKFGEKAKEVVASKARELGMSPERLGQLAAESPQAVLALFDAKPHTPQGNSQHSSSVSIPPVKPAGSDELESPEKSLLAGASTREQMDYMKKVKEHTYKRLGIQDS